MMAELKFVSIVYGLVCVVPIMIVSWEMWCASNLDSYIKVVNVSRYGLKATLVEILSEMLKPMIGVYY